MTVHLADAPVLETERLILRIPQERDYERWEAFVTSERARFVGGGPDMTEGRAWRAFASIIGHWLVRGFGSFAAEDRASGQVIGSFGPWFPKPWPEREIGWTVWDPAYEGGGWAAEAARATIDFAYRDLGWDTCVSYIDPDNARSIALAERMGAWRDDAATKPDMDEPPALVYRHPDPGAVS